MSEPFYPPRLTKERKAWLASLKDGDEVAVIDEDGRISNITTVRRHPYQEGFVSGRDFGGNADFGLSGKSYPYHNSRRRDWIVPITDEIKHSLAMRKLRQEFCSWCGYNSTNSTRQSTVTDNQLIAIARILGWEVP